MWFVGEETFVVHTWAKRLPLPLGFKKMFFCHILREKCRAGKHDTRRTETRHFPAVWRTRRRVPWCHSNTTRLRAKRTTQLGQLFTLWFLTFNFCKEEIYDNFSPFRFHMLTSAEKTKKCFQEVATCCYNCEILMLYKVDCFGSGAVFVYNHAQNDTKPF